MQGGIPITGPTLRKFAFEFFDKIKKGESSLIYNVVGQSEFESNLLKRPSSFLEVNEEWLIIFNELKNQHSDKDEANKKKIESMLIFILKGTVAYYRSELELNLFDKSKNSTYKEKREILDKYSKGSKVIEDNSSFKLEDFNIIVDKTETVVVERDCLNISQELVENPNLKNVALLNMASNVNSNGGAKQGSWAQEENITRRSNYFLHLTVNLGSKYQLPEYAATYSPKVYVFRDNEESGYKLLQNPFVIDIIGVSAPDLRFKPKSDVEFKTDLRQRLKKIFEIAIQNGVEALVLGAIGCGAFKNPPEQVSEVFAELVQQFAGYIKFIAFAILPNIRNKENPRKNYDCFVKHFGSIGSAKYFKPSNQPSSQPSISTIREQGRINTGPPEFNQFGVGAPQPFTVQPGFDIRANGFNPLGAGASNGGPFNQRNQGELTSPSFNTWNNIGPEQNLSQSQKIPATVSYYDRYNLSGNTGNNSSESSKTNATTNSFGSSSIATNNTLYYNNAHPNPVSSKNSRIQSSLSEIDEDEALDENTKSINLQNLNPNKKRK